MIPHAFQKSSQSLFSLLALALVGNFLFVALQSSNVWADTTPPAATNNGGINAATCQSTNTCLNGSTNNGNLNSQQTSVGIQNGSSYSGINAPSQAVSNGGSSALVLPRNPLTLPNAGLGRSNLGLQFGVNNNPGFGNVFGKGAGNALGWFMQGGVTIPFGKIPDVIANPRNAQLDDSRQQKLDSDRQVFGSVQNPLATTTVQGQVVKLNAYNYSTAASPKVGSNQEALREVLTERNLNTPKVLALGEALVFSKPLGKGDKIGTVQIGEEYKYIGHTSSGWVKLILANGREGWSKGQFEYLKNDYTEIDSITIHNSLDDIKQSLNTRVKPQISALKQTAVTTHN